MSRKHRSTDAILHDVAGRHPGQREFLQAVEEVLETIEPVLVQHPEFASANIIERIIEPERVVMFRTPWIDDQKRVQVNRGFRVQFNSALGPCKGGLRFHASVNLGIIKFLAFEQTFKNALTTLPLGGGKGGSDFSPRDKSDNEIMRFCQSFMTELHRHVGPAVDVPAGDIGVGGREIGWLFGQYKRLTRRFEGVLTGKGVGWGGSLMRPQATGYGAAYFGQRMLETRGESFANKTVAISGYGNVGAYALEKLSEFGARVVTVADESHFIYAPDGFSPEQAIYLRDLWQVRRQTLDAYVRKFGGELHPGRPWSVPCDVALPTAAQNEIDEQDARALVANGCRYVIEGANMPCSAEACDVFRAAGVLQAPGKAANAGGVAVSGLEMSQNAMMTQWSREEVDEKLQRIMSDIHDTCLRKAAEVERPGDYIVGANVAGFVKVAQAMLDQGVV